MPKPSDDNAPYRSLGILPSDRALVTGATGWFGRTFLALMDGHRRVLALGSNESPSLPAWNPQLVRDFRPTVVANFAFLTKDRLGSLETDSFIAINQELTRRFLDALELPTVRLGLTVSSGAAVSSARDSGRGSEDWYGRLKGAEEKEALQRSSSSKSVAVVRAYSVSGPFVRRPEAYAFSHFVLQAMGGRISISADQPVFRRYVAVADLLTVTLLWARSGRSGVVESGGDLIEMQELAEVVRREVNPRALITRVPMTSSEPQIYASDNSNWLAACSEVGFTPKGLAQQVRAVHDYLAAERDRTHRR